MVKISKIAVCAVLIQAGFIYAAQAASSVPVEVRGMAVNSAMTDKLSETAAGLSAAQQTGDNGRSDELLSRLFAGGGVKASETPIYAEQAEAPVSRAVPIVSSVTTNAAGNIVITIEVASSSASAGAQPATPAVSPAPELKPALTAAEISAAKAENAAAAAAAAKKKEATERKNRNLGAGCMGLGLLLILLFL